jgi:hypothetical protein
MIGTILSHYRIENRMANLGPGQPGLIPVGASLPGSAVLPLAVQDSHLAFVVASPRNSGRRHRRLDVGNLLR